ncbi:MAG: hypothetical protein SOZ18_01725 [Phocaeicola sp.]|nr:hypothetical protein [Phocaeicola sp.]
MKLWLIPFFLNLSTTPIGLVMMRYIIDRVIHFVPNPALTKA